MWWKTESRAREREREGKNRGVIETKKKPRILQMKRERRGMTDPSAESRDQMVSTVACTHGCLSVQHLSDFFKQLWLFFKLLQTRWEKTCGNGGGTETCTSTCWAIGKLGTIDQHRSVLVTDTSGQFGSPRKCKLWHVNRLQVCKNASELDFQYTGNKKQQHPLSPLQYTVDAVNHD